MKNILFLLSVLLPAIEYSANASQPEAEEAPFRRYMSLGVELAGPAMHFIAPETFVLSASADLEIRPNLMAAIELGNAHVNVKQPAAEYNVSGQFFRIGANYNLLQQNPAIHGNQIFMFLRYAASFNTHNAPVVQLIDPVWGNQEVSFDQLSYQAHWAEVGAGLRTRIFHNFFLGWNVRAAFMISQTDNENTKPFFVSGFGRNQNNTQFSFQYFIYYRIPTK